MNKKTLTTVLIVILIAICTFTIIFFPKIMKKDSDNKQQTENKPQTEQTQNNDLPVQPNNSQETEPEKETEPEPEKQPEKNPEPEKETEKQPEKKPEPEKEPEVSKEPELVAPPVQIENYKDFSLLQGKDAQQAYDYLNEFLNSKYSILINKQNKVGSDYVPTNLRNVSGSEYKLESVAAAALEAMLSAAKSAGHGDLFFYSGYRSYASQSTKFTNKVNSYMSQGYSRAQAEEKAGEYLAPPGSSEHHTGLAADVSAPSLVNKRGKLTDDFDQTNQWKWLSENCSEYGFIIRYRKSAEGITGFKYEPWHFRYIGVEHAKACTALGITYEEYYSMLIKFRDQAKAEIGA